MSEIPDRLTAALADRYRIERELGAGGMATVYLAQDLKHDRKVAVKVLHPELAATIGVERFLAEIKVTANLQHPNVLALFDSGIAAGQAYYVMPYVEGESLRDRLTREKQLPVDDALTIARGVAAALEYAHAHGVIHRDIKPENILLQTGQPVVADFGIALAVQQAGGRRLTQTGLSLGTPEYMSPEQAMGARTLDVRTDVYALGVVTYEMLAGAPPFTGPNAQAIVAQIVTEKPRPLRALRETVPEQVEAAVRHALEKLPADRFATAAEFARALAPDATRSWAGSPPPAGTRPRMRQRLGVAICLLATVAAFVVGRMSSRSGPPPGQPSRLALLAPTLEGSGAGVDRQLAITRDGSTIVYVGKNGKGQNALYRQRLDAQEPTLIQGGDGLQSPQISYDARWIIATPFGIGKRYRLPLEGGDRTALGAGVQTLFGSWSPDGTFWFSGAGGLTHLLPGDTTVSPFPQPSGNLIMQQVLDDGRRALMVHKSFGLATGSAVLLDLRTGDTTQVLDRAVGELRYTAGHLLYALGDGTLYAVPFDVQQRKLMGPATEIAQDVSVSAGALAQLAVAANGTVAYIAQEPHSLVLLDRAGASRPAMAELHNYHAPHFSPDGRRLSTDFTTPDGRNVWILSLDQGTLSRATFERDGHDASWAADGKSIVYTSFRSGVLGIYRTRPGSTAPAESLLVSAQLAYSGTWLPGGGELLTDAVNLQPGSGSDIGIVRNGGRGPIEPLAASSFQERYAAVSPDGKWLAFASDQSGQQQVYVRPLKGGAEDVQVSQQGGNEPVWGPDGHELFYRGDPEGQVVLMLATLRTVPQLSVTSRRTLFSVADKVEANPHANYDVSPDGKTIAMVRRSPTTRIVVIQNLPELVRRLRGGDRGVAP